MIALTAMTLPEVATIPDLLARSAADHADRMALASSDGPVLTHAELSATIDRLVAALWERGVGRRSRPAVVLPNGVDMAVALLAASSAATCVPLAPQATPDEYRIWFRDGRVSHLLTSARADQTARLVAAELGLPVIDLVNGDRGYHVTSLVAATVRVAAASRPSPADVALVLMTSGSTGLPKRVPLTHANLLAGTRSVAAALDLGATDRVLVMWEQYHVGGVVDLLLAPLSAGGEAVCAGGFDAPGFFELLERVRPTWFQGVPTTLRELLVHARLAGRLSVASSLRVLRSVASALPPDLMLELESVFGVPVIQTFGMTEASPLITTNRLPPGIRKAGSTGVACDCEVAVPDADGQPLPPGTTGEIGVRGPNVFAGYEDDPEANARVFRNGWFMTGDVGHLDAEGFLFLTGRVKEMINRGGEKIAPAEIEGIVGLHPDIAEAAAFAIPHTTLGEDVALAVVPNAGVSVDREAIRSHLAAHVSRFKVPAVVLVVDNLPRCPIGKIRRRALADLVAMQQATARSEAVARSQPCEDPLVPSLAALWAAHLDLPSVDIDEDFEILGGDSLSRIRLALAVESLYAVSLPEGAAATITTVRRMAAEVRGLGGRLALPADTAVGASPSRADIWGDGDALGLADASPAEVRRRLLESRTIREFESVRESLLNTLTLEELAKVVRQAFHGRPAVWAGRLAWLAPRGMRGTESLRVASELAAWRHEILTEDARQASSRWRRRRLAHGAILYRRHEVATGRRRLVVGFAGNHQRLMLPTHQILDSLPPRDDLLLLMDPDRRHFASGVPGISGRLEGVFDWIAERSTEQGHDSVVSFGTSGGGLTAICAAYALGLERVAAVAADSPANHGELERILLEQLAVTQADRHPLVILAYDSANLRDRAGGEAIAGHLPRARSRILSATGAHNTLQPAAGAGRLAAVLEDLLGPGPDRPFGSGQVEANRGAA